MKILTTDNRLLTLIRLGKPDSECMTNIVVCLDEKGKRHSITPQDISMLEGCFYFPQCDIKEKKEL